MPFAVFNYAVAPDNRTIVFVTTEPASTRSIPVIYSIQDDGRRLTRIAAGTAPETGEENAPQGRFGGGGGISELHFSRDGRALFSGDCSIYRWLCRMPQPRAPDWPQLPAPAVHRSR
jgi:hypothetical protein